MYKALNYWVYGGFDGQKTPYEFIDYAAAKGLSGVELTVGDVLSPDITEAECRKIAAYAKSKNIGLRSIATGTYWGLALGTADETERRKALEFSRKYLQIGAWLGVECVLIVPSATRVAWDPSRPVIPYKVAWEKSVESLKELLKTAEKLQVAMALENVWNRFLLSPMEWKLFLDQFASPWVGIYLDLGNCCYIGRPEDYIEILGKYIKAIHFKNFTENDCAGGLHGFGDDLLTGEVHFDSVKKALDAINYQGPCTVEMIPFSRLPDLVLPDQALADKVTAQMLSI